MHVLLLRSLSLAVMFTTASRATARASFSFTAGRRGSAGGAARRSLITAAPGGCNAPAASASALATRVPSRQRRRSLSWTLSTAPSCSTSARYLSGSASSSSDDSSSSSSVVDTCRRKIRDALSAVEVKVTGAYDDPNGSHVSIEVVSSVFEGKRPVQRQQLVYKAIWEELRGPVHAVDSMVCKTPSEASASAS